MRRAFLISGLLTFVLGTTTVLVVGCSDTDPNYGPAGAITNYSPILGGGSTTSTGGTSGTVPTDPKGAFGALFTATSTTCGSCHSSAQTVGGEDKVFYGPVGTPTADTSYPLFKKANLQQDKATNPFYNIAPPHTGGALKPEQKTIMEAWIAAEKGGATDAGGGG